MGEGNGVLYDKQEALTHCCWDINETSGRLNVLSLVSPALNEGFQPSRRVTPAAGLPAPPQKEAWGQRGGGSELPHFRLLKERAHRPPSVRTPRRAKVFPAFLKVSLVARSLQQIEAHSGRSGESLVQDSIKRRVDLKTCHMGFSTWAHRTDATFRLTQRL